jgi:hypothetical protein
MSPAKEVLEKALDLDEHDRAEVRSTVALAELDAETRFRTRAALGSPEEALRLLDALDRRESREHG